VGSIIIIKPLVSIAPSNSANVNGNLTQSSRKRQRFHCLATSNELMKLSRTKLDSTKLSGFIMTNFLLFFFQRSSFPGIPSSTGVQMYNRSYTHPVSNHMDLQPVLRVIFTSELSSVKSFIYLAA